MAKLDPKIQKLRDLVLRLEPDGADGFEGLLAAVLTEVTKTTFSIAQKGFQGGKDGHSALNSGAVSFEAKLYRDRVHHDQVVTKIAQLGAHDRGTAELFIVE